MFAEPQPTRPAMPVPTPKPSISTMFSGLKDLVQNVSSRPAVKGPGENRSGSNDMFLGQEIFDSSNTSHNVDIPMARSLFSSPKNFSKIRRSLSSIFTAKSYVFCSTFFGQKSFYGDEFDFKKEPLHPNKRRQIRFGLKSIVDFIIQLDAENLKTCLLREDSNVKNFVEAQDNPHESRFSPNSFFGLMYRTNPKKCNHIFEILERIVSNLHFSQSMGEFLASNQTIESSKLVLSEAVKRGPDLGGFLRGGPFASCAQVYRHLSSRFDFDMAYARSSKNNTQRNSNSVTPRTRAHDFSKNKYPGTRPL